MECYALTNLEGPFLGISGWFPAFEQFRHCFVIGVDFDKAIHQHIGLIDGNPVFQQAWIEVVGGATAANTELENSAFLWRTIGFGSHCRADQTTHAACSNKTKTCRTRHEGSAC